MAEIKGYVHSIETCGTLDGPGIRYVVFLQGCPLRCKFCHNPDTWQLDVGRQYSVDELMKDVLKYRLFIRNGGLTLSGGEPLWQADFAAEIFRACKKQGIHTAVDTSGAAPLTVCKEALDAVDLVILDIKSIDTYKCERLTGKGNENALQILDYLEGQHKKVWIRHVVVPGITEDYDDIKKMGEYLTKYSVIERVEILPFHKMGEYKWKQLGLYYELEETKEPRKESILRIKEILKEYKLNVV